MLLNAFLQLTICWTCFGHFVPIIWSSRLYLCYCRYMVCNVLVAGGRLLGAEQQAMCPGWEWVAQFPSSRTHILLSVPNSRPPATKTLHTICGNTTIIVSSSWWWARKCPKHVELIISAVKHSVASSCVSSLRLYYDARTNIHQIYNSPLQNQW